MTRVASSSQRGGALDAHLGDAIEEFMHYAEDLKHYVAKGVQKLYAEGCGLFCRDQPGRHHWDAMDILCAFVSSHIAV